MKKKTGKAPESENFGNTGDCLSESGLLRASHGKRLKKCELDFVTCSMIAGTDVPGFIRGIEVEREGIEYLAYPCDGLLSAADCVYEKKAICFPALIAAVCDAIKSTDYYMLDPGCISFTADNLYCRSDGSSAGFCLCRHQRAGSKAESENEVTDGINPIRISPESEARILIYDISQFYLYSGCLPPACLAFAHYIAGWYEKNGDFSILKNICISLTGACRNDIPVLFDADHGMIYALKEEKESLGRDSSMCSLRINDSRFVSRIHAEISNCNGERVFCDCGSSNGSAINGKATQSGEAVVLKCGDILRLADVSLTYYC